MIRTKKAPKRYTLTEAVLSLEIPESARLRLLSDLYPPKCAASGVTLFSEFNAYASRFRDLTGIDLGESIDSSTKLLSEEDIRELNSKLRDLKRPLMNLSRCIIESMG